MLNQIPRPLLVFGVLLLGIGLFFVIQEPHSVCNSQLEVFKEAQAGSIFPRQTKTGQRPASFPRLIDACKIGNSPGACYDLFSLLKKLVRDLNGSPQECLVPFGKVDEVKRALLSGEQLIVQIAWGDRPPEAGGTARMGWLEATDLALYCQLKSTMIKVYGEEEWESFRLSTQAKLPGEAQIIQDGVCLNCESIKKASEVLSPEEIWSKSLFSLRCDQYN
jgi:hypothetical protein